MILDHGNVIFMGYFYLGHSPWLRLGWLDPECLGKNWDMMGHCVMGNSELRKEELAQAEKGLAPVAFTVIRVICSGLE